MNDPKYVICSGCKYAITWLEHERLKIAMDCPKCKARKQFGPGVYIDGFIGYDLNTIIKVKRL